MIKFDSINQLIALLSILALMFTNLNVQGQVDPEEARRKMLLREGRTKLIENKTSIPDLSNHDAETLRLLARNLFLKVQQLELQLAKEREAIHDLQQTIEDLKTRLDSPSFSVEQYSSDTHNDISEELRDQVVHRSLRSLVDDVPKNLFPNKGDQWRSNIEGQLVNQWINENIEGDDFRGKLILTNLRVGATGIGRVSCKGKPFKFKGVSIESGLSLDLVSQIPLIDARSLKAGQTVDVKGTIKRIDIYMPSNFNAPRASGNLHIELYNSEIRWP